MFQRGGSRSSRFLRGNNDDQQDGWWLGGGIVSFFRGGLGLDTGCQGVLFFLSHPRQGATCLGLVPAYVLLCVGSLDAMYIRSLIPLYCRYKRLTSQYFLRSPKHLQVRLGEESRPRRKPSIILEPCSRQPLSTMQTNTNHE